jgi:predicted MFS family arabinose efflux permease
LFSIAFLGIFLFRNFWAIAGFWILNEIAWTFCSGAQSAWAIDALGYAKKKSKLQSLISQGNVFEKTGKAIGGLLGMVIVAINFRFIWLAISLNYFILFLVSWKYVEERNFKSEKVPHNYLKKTLIKIKESFSFILHAKNRNFRILMWTEFFMGIGVGAYFIGIPLLFTQILGLKPEYLSGLYAAIAIVAITGPLITHKVSKKHGFGKSLFGVLFIAGISILALALSGSILFAIVAFGVAEIVFAIFDTLYETTKHHESDSKIRASLGSVDMIVWAISGSIGTFLAGIGIATIGIVDTLLIGGSIIAITSFAYLWMRE